jgi:hypothetical protein
VDIFLLLTVERASFDESLVDQPQPLLVSVCDRLAASLFGMTIQTRLAISSSGADAVIE